MPKVAGKHFSYDAKGMKAAKDYAEKTGKPMKMKYGGKVKKMKGGGSCRGMGAATQGGNFKLS